MIEGYLLVEETYSHFKQRGRNMDKSLEVEVKTTEKSKAFARNNI